MERQHLVAASEGLYQATPKVIRKLTRNLSGAGGWFSQFAGGAEGTCRPELSPPKGRSEQTLGTFLTTWWTSKGSAPRKFGCGWSHFILRNSP